MSKAYIILEDGRVFEGRSFGAKGEIYGELVFTTGVVGYIETLTDPSYYGQIIMHTFPQMGNYGMISEDAGADAPMARGVVVREHCVAPSNFRSEESYDEYLRCHGVVGVCGVDTRELTQIIRENGTMNAMLTDKPPEGVPEALKSYKISGAVAEASVKAAELHKAEGEALYNVALIDYGAKSDILRELTKRGCDVTILTHDTAAEDVLALKPDGVMLGCGPGDPADNAFCVEQIKKLFGKVPMFGIGLGHQLTALAAGGKTNKLKYGHRGANQPVREVNTGRVYITGQNHGYAVTSEDLASFGAELIYVNVNDGTCEGLHYPGKRAFSLQFLPNEPDMEFSFDSFTQMMGGAE